MCQKCGCNTCETDSTALMLNESKAPRTILSEGLKHHIDNNKPLTEHLYRAGSSAYFNLIAEARSLYSRGILEFTNEDDKALLTETNLGHFGMFEGKKVPLDFPIELNEQMDLEDELANMEFGMDYDQLGSNEKEWVRDEIDNMPFRENLNESNFEDYLDDIEKRIYVDRRGCGKVIIHPFDKPDVRRPSRDYIVVDGNNVTSVQGYNSGPISVLADRYGLDDEDDRMTPMGKTNASGRISLLSSNILKDAIKAIEASRDAEAKNQQDYYI